MTADPGRWRRLARRTWLTCGRGVVQAVVSVAGLPLFFVSVLSVISLSAGMGVLLAAPQPADRAAAGPQAAPLRAGLVPVRSRRRTGPGRSRSLTG